MANKLNVKIKTLKDYTINIFHNKTKSTNKSTYHQKVSVFRLFNAGHGSMGELNLTVFTAVNFVNDSVQRYKN